MPGTKSINWTEANKAKFLDALLNYSIVKIDAGTALAIAQHCGIPQNPTAIHSLLANSRARFKPLNGAPGKNDFQRTSANVTGRVIGKSNQARTIGGRVTKGGPRTKTKNPVTTETKDSKGTVDDCKNEEVTTVKREDSTALMSPPDSVQSPYRNQSRTPHLVNPEYCAFEHPEGNVASSYEDSEPSDPDYQPLIDSEVQPYEGYLNPLA